METTQGSAAMVERDGALGQLRIKPARRELRSTPGTGEEAALIGVEFQLDQVGAVKARFDELHATFTSGTGMVKRPPSWR